MGIIIKRIDIVNFKKFENFQLVLNEKCNVLIGDNETGKSTILQAIDLCLGGSIHKVESLGISEIFNKKTIETFLDGDKKYDDLPIISIEITTSDFGNFDYEGKKNTDSVNAYGVKLLIIPNDEYSEEIKKILEKQNCHFPSEYYKIEFRTFADISYNTYNKKIKHYLIDNTTIDSESSIREFTSNVYKLQADAKTRNNHLSEFKSVKQSFEKDVLEEFNKEKLYTFGLNKSQKFDLENNLAIFDDGINISNKGRGKQTLIKTSLAVEKKSDKIDILLIEEPENHLSSNNMLKMIDEILSKVENQLIITTHNNLILSRLNLINSFLLGSNEPLSFSSLPKDTSDFFCKQTNSNLLQFILSKKAILIEGAAEYILLEKFYEKVLSSKPFCDGVSILSVNGLSFLRYLDIAKKLGIKTAIITDNDKDYQKNITNKYKDYLDDYIEVFSDRSAENYTFEVALYNDNKDLIENSDLTSSASKILYMLNNKSESSFRLLKMIDNGDIDLTVPLYIEDAFKWIKN
jgi:predicted ATP-dependent endonuclease of OLD family